MSSGSERVQAAIARLGFEHRVVVLAETARTAQDAAQALGCAVAQIAKSLVFRGADSGRPVLVIASGVNRVNQAAVAALVGEPIEKADADFVRAQTGFAIGGVPPLGHATPLRTLLDLDLQQHEELWAAAGTPHAVFRLAPAELQAMTAGEWVVIA
ncbi:MAG TPA: YbaK/EbsC family protein [Terriglobales bacterium]|nr:YbaK/EbsC family protein [Terriglobales bacterium]